MDNDLIITYSMIDSCYDNNLVLREIRSYNLLKKTTGMKIDSLQTGIWEYYDEQGNKEYQIDYTNGINKSKLISHYKANPDNFNLITNPSFESHTKLICGYATYDTLRNAKDSARPHIDIVYSINSDYSINEDYKKNNVYGWCSFANEYAKIMDIRECKDSPSYKYVIDSIMPKSGYAFADLHLATLLDLSLSDNRAIYGTTILQNRLLYPLIKGQKYYLEFWIKHNFTTKLYSNGLRIFFSEKPFTKADFDLLRTKEADIALNKIIKAEDWEKLSFEFEAKNYARYMCITSTDSKEVVKEKNENWNGSIFNRYGYYFLNANYLLDDFKLVKKKNKNLNVINYEPIMTLEVDTSIIISKITDIKKESESAYIFDDLIFEIDSYELKHTMITRLDSLVKYINQNHMLKLEIYGHTDDSGSVNYNNELSFMRAMAVYNYLSQCGISENIITYYGFGSLIPKVPNISETNKATNRRVEIKIIYD